MKEFPHKYSTIIYNAIFVRRDLLDIKSRQDPKKYYRLFSNFNKYLLHLNNSLESICLLFLSRISQFFLNSPIKTPKRLRLCFHCGNKRSGNQFSINLELFNAVEFPLDIRLNTFRKELVNGACLNQLQEKGQKR